MRPLKAHMLDEMGHSGVGLIFVARSGADYIAAVYYLGGRGFVDDAQAIGERGDMTEIGHRFYLNFLRKGKRRQGKSW